MKTMNFMKLIAILGLFLICGSNLMASEDMETCKKLYLKMDEAFGATDESAEQACKEQNSDCIAWWVNWSEARNENLDNVIYHYSFKKDVCTRVRMDCVKEKALKEEYKNMTGKLILSLCGGNLQ